ncbi:MAG TPA: hypothetical protein VN620_09445 [Candidatus Methylomirabilis sp.]|nr:hypothetical protein [Candidatus Methylomirabilis sp.]
MPVIGNYGFSIATGALLLRRFPLAGVRLLLLLVIQLLLLLLVLLVHLLCLLLVFLF